MAMNWYGFMKDMFKQTKVGNVISTISDNYTSNETDMTSSQTMNEANPVPDTQTAGMQTDPGQGGVLRGVISQYTGGLLGGHGSDVSQTAQAEQMPGLNLARGASTQPINTMAMTSDPEQLYRRY